MDKRFGPEDEITPEKIQKMLDENQTIITNIIEYQRMGRLWETTQYQKALHGQLQLLVHMHQEAEKYDKQRKSQQQQQQPAQSAGRTNYNPSMNNQNAGAMMQGNPNPMAPAGAAPNQHFGNTMANPQLHTSPLSSGPSPAITTSPQPGLAMHYTSPPPPAAAYQQPQPQQGMPMQHQQPLMQPVQQQQQQYRHFPQLNQM
eukprot:TRINITY_DN66591_c4_g14_i1.p1 TRINITY_DN66591_c4_g14~~TRINITY_DN66591_c4_g14_i1.p1  ORF type:complete len:201 (+),score=38.98 TRINITY_DN66591_c4_g14_i1:21-623(+)